MRAIFNIQRSYPIEGKDGKANLARIVGTTPEIASTKDYAALIAEQYNGRISVVAGTLQNVTKGHQKMVSMFVTTNTESMPFAEGEAAGKTRQLVAANLYSDEENELWQVVGEGDNRRLMAVAQETINEVLDQRLKSLRHFTTAGYDAAKAEPFYSNEHVVFVDTETASVRSGVGVVTTEATQVLDFRTRKLVSVDNLQVLASSDFELDGDDKSFDVFKLRPQELSSALVADRAEALIEYYRQIYARFPEFFRRLEEMIRSKATVS